MLKLSALKAMHVDFNDSLKVINLKSNKKQTTLWNFILLSLGGFPLTQALNINFYIKKNA